MACIWCGKRIDHDDDGASFLFLAKREGRFVLVDEWRAASPHAEGHQFYCHMSCFRGSVPAQQQQALAAAFDED